MYNHLNEIYQSDAHHYWINWRAGQHHVIKVEDCEHVDNEVLFSGHYEDCVKWMEDNILHNAEIMLNI